MGRALSHKNQRNGDFSSWLLNLAYRHLTWTRNLLKDLGLKLNPAVVYEDNAAAIPIATRAYLTSRTRHAHLRAVSKAKSAFCS